MQNQLKNRKRKGISLSFDVCDKLEQYSKNTEIPESRVIELALKEYLANKV